MVLPKFSANSVDELNSKTPLRMRTVPPPEPPVSRIDDVTRTSPSAAATVEPSETRISLADENAARLIDGANPKRLVVYRTVFSTVTSLPAKVSVSPLFMGMELPSTVIAPGSFPKNPNASGAATVSVLIVGVVAL